MIAVALPTAIGSQPYVGDQQDKITPDALEDGDRLGRSLAIDGDTIVLGSFLADDDEGLVFVHEATTQDGETTAEHRATLSTEDVHIDEPADATELGSDVDVSGDLLVAGAAGVDTADKFEAGAAFVFANGEDGWTQLAALPAPDPQALDAFGRTVATDGTHVAVAEPEDEIPGEYSSNGKVHVYERTAEGLVHEASLTPPADDDRERLGVSMAFQDGTLAVGAPQDDTSTGYGAVYLYEETEGTWSQTDRLTAPDDAQAESFGRDVALDGGLLVAGAPGPQAAMCCPSPPVPEGQAHAFQLDDGEWTHDGELDPVTSAEGAGVGMSVAIDAGQAFVAAPSAPADSVFGLVHAFAQTETGWAHTGVTVPADPASGDRFGQAIDADAGHLTAGAPGDDGAGDQAGAGYLFGDATPSLVTPQ
jgi:hypothetical protein